MTVPMSVARLVAVYEKVERGTTLHVTLDRGA